MAPGMGRPLSTKLATSRRPFQSPPYFNVAGLFATQLPLYHVVPALPVPGLARALLDGVADKYKGPVTLGRDGTFVAMPAHSRAIAVGNLLSR